MSAEVPETWRPYPDLFILPLHRLLQVRYFSNKTFLFQTQLTDVLIGRKSLGCGERETKRERSDACTCWLCEGRAVKATCL